MSNNKQEMPNNSITTFNGINKVDGFDPMSLAVQYTDMNNGATRFRLPVMAQMGWFRLVYPQGRIALDVKTQGDCFVAHAKVYPHYEVAEHCYLAEASASRKWDPQKPTVSPREWAQTAAVGIALRNAGFGLQCDAAGDAFDSPAADEIGSIQFTTGSAGDTGQPPAANIPQGNEYEVPQEYALGQMPPVPEQEPLAAIQLQPTASIPPQAPPADTPPVNSPEQPQSKGMDINEAFKMMCPVKKYAGKTLGEVSQCDPSCLVWLANSFKGDASVAEAAKTICEHALDNGASA